MGTRTRLREELADQVITSGELGGNQWYRISQYHPLNGRQDQAAAQFVLSDGNEARNDFIRLRASVAYKDPKASLLLEEYSCWGDPSFALARLIWFEAGGCALEVRTEHPATAALRLRIRHEQFWPGLRWAPVAFTAVPDVPTDGTLLVQRGARPTGAFLPADLQNSWVNYGENYAPAGYRMSPGSLIQLRGVIRSGTVGEDGVIFELPVGYRPAYRTQAAALSTYCASGRMEICPDGRVIALNVENEFLSIDTISFLAEL